MAYYEYITDNEIYILTLLYRLISSISFIVYISLFIVYFFGKVNKNFTDVINIQICIASMMHSISYLLPSAKDAATKTTVLCYIQALLNSLSDLCSLLVATAVMIVIYLNYKSQDFVEKNKGKILLTICLLCWLLPLIFCIIIFMYGDVKSSGGAFCWVNNETISYIYYSFCLLGYIIYFSVLYKIISNIHRIIKKTNSIEMNDEYFNVFRRLTFVLCLTFSVFSLNFGITTAGAIGGEIPGQIYFGLSLFTQIGEMISCPLYVIVFCFDKKRYAEFIRIIKCQQHQPLPKESKILECKNVKIEDDEENEDNI